MGIFDDSFSIGLKHPIDEESWKIIEDVELVNTERVYFTIPSGKRVDFIKADVLDKIRAEIEEVDMNITYQENKDRKASWGLRKALRLSTSTESEDKV